MLCGRRAPHARAEQHSRSPTIRAGAGCHAIGPGLARSRPSASRALPARTGIRQAPAARRRQGLSHHFHFGNHAVVDSYLELDSRGAEMLVQIFTERDEKNSIAVASNEAFTKAHMFRRTHARCCRNFTGSGAIP